jgi:hypothetical protein
MSWKSGIVTVCSVLALAAFGTLCAARTASAEVIESATGLASPSQTVTFDEISLPQDSLIANNYSSYGVTFDGVIYDPYPFGDNNFPGNVMSNFIPGHPVNNPVTIHFASPVTAADVQLHTQTGTTTLTALLNGDVVDSHAFSTNLSSGDYFGFAGETFNALQVFVSSSDNGFEGKNLQYAVPEPGTLTLLISALLGLAGAFYLRRRRATA